MASITGNGSRGYHKFTLTVNETATSVENNTSTISYSFQLSPIQTSWAWEQWGSSISYSLTINGTSYTGTIPNYDGYATVTLKSGTQTVSHNADGTKTISYSFSVTDGAGQRYTPGNASASGTFALSTIPRATTPKLNATSVIANDANGVTITISPASSTFKHKIRYNFGTLGNYVSGFKVDGVSIGFDFIPQGKNVVFTPPTLLLDEIPDSNSGVCSISLYTYTSAGVHIGTKTINLTINVPDYKPVISASAKGNNLLLGAYVEGKSTATIKVVATSSYGAKIKTLSSTIDGKTYTGAEFVTSVLSKGDKALSVVATDTRGKTATFNPASFATVYEYFNPKITSLTAQRQSDGTTVIATIKGSIASVNNKNAKTITVTLNGVTKTITSDGYTINGSTTFTDVPTDNTFTCTAKITDSYTNATKDVVLPTVAVTMDFHSSGKGIAMGKVAEHENLLDVAWKTKVNNTVEIVHSDFEALSLKHLHDSYGVCIAFKNNSGTLGNIGMIGSEVDRPLRRWNSEVSESHVILDTEYVKDYVVGQGKTGYWLYEKWNNGILKLYRNYSLSNIAVTSAWGALYSSPQIALPSFPTEEGLTFTATPQVNLTWNGAYSAILDGATGVSTTKCGYVYIFRADSVTLASGSIAIQVIGKWK